MKPFINQINFQFKVFSPVYFIKFVKQKFSVSVINACMFRIIRITECRKC